MPDDDRDAVRKEAKRVIEEVAQPALQECAQTKMRGRLSARMVEPPKQDGDTFSCRLLDKKPDGRVTARITASATAKERGVVELVVKAQMNREGEQEREETSGDIADSGQRGAMESRGG